MISSTFVQSLGMSLSTIAHDIVIYLEAQENCRIVNNYTKFEIEEVESVKKYKIYLGCMSHKETRTLLIRLSLNKTAESIHQLMKITVSYTNSITGEKVTLESSLSTNREIEDEPKNQMPYEIANHYYRYMVASTIEEVVKEIALSSEDNKFDVAQSKLTSLVDEIKQKVPELAKSTFGEQYISALQEVVSGMQNKQIYSIGMHYANAYSTMFYLQRSSCVDQLLGISKAVKAMSLNTVSTIEKRRYFPAYVTHSLDQNAKQDITKYVKRYTDME